MEESGEAAASASKNEVGFQGRMRRMCCWWKAKIDRLQDAEQKTTYSTQQRKAKRRQTHTQTAIQQRVGSKSDIECVDWSSSCSSLLFSFSLCLALCLSLFVLRRICPTIPSWVGTYVGEATRRTHPHCLIANRHKAKTKPSTNNDADLSSSRHTDTKPVFAFLALSEKAGCERVKKWPRRMWCRSGGPRTR